MFVITRVFIHQMGDGGSGCLVTHTCLQLLSLCTDTESSSLTTFSNVSGFKESLHGLWESIDRDIGGRDAFELGEMLETVEGFEADMGSLVEQEHISQLSAAFSFFSNLIILLFASPRSFFHAFTSLRCSFS